jgi:D-serine deaminase-like pyridoxal phosphate-dependent protein
MRRRAPERYLPTNGTATEVPRQRRSDPMPGAFLDDDALTAIDTPAVVVDLDRVDARIAAMADTMRARGVRLRPHAKTHKSLAFGRRQLDAGAVGLTVPTIGEAEVFAAGGFDDLFIAYPVIAQGPKAERLRTLAERCSLSVGADSAVGLDALASALGGAAGRVSVVIEVDVGGGRTGVRPEDAGAIARHATGLGLTVAGVFTHGGHGYAGREERVAAATDEVEGLARAAESLRAEGIEPTVVSAGSTPTAELSAQGPITEERPGTYIFGDRQQAFLTARPLDDTALFVASTVVSHGSGGGFVVDAGAKILGKDVAPYLAGHGSIVGYPDAVIERVNDHHGVVALPASAARPTIGDVVWIAPNHVCPVVNLVDEYVIAQDGRVVDRWPVDARGRNS